MPRLVWVFAVVAGCTTEQTCGLGGSCDWRLSHSGPPDAATSLTSAEMAIDGGPRPAEARGNAPLESPTSPSAASASALPSATPSTSTSAAASAATEPETALHGASDAAPAPTSTQDASSSGRTTTPEAAAPTRPVATPLVLPTPNPITEGVQMLPQGYVLSDAGAGPFTQ